jgi:hypothetical protein
MTLKMAVELGNIERFLRYKLIRFTASKRLYLDFRGLPFFLPTASPAESGFVLLFDIIEK